MSEQIPEAEVASTPLKDDAAAPDGRTQEQLLADIVSNSDFIPNEESLPEEQVPEVDPGVSEEVEDPKETDEPETQEVEEEANTEEVEDEVEDADEQSATQDTTLFTPEELDLEAKVSIKIDGQDSEVSFSDLIKGYSTEQSLSKKGRELGDARKNFEKEYQDKLNEVKEMSDTSVAILYKSEQEHAKDFHTLEEKIEKARDENDTYTLGELKDKREQIQKKYWTARKEREALQKTVNEKSQEQMQSAWNDQLKSFDEAIPTLIPGFNETVAKDIREFALNEGIKQEVLDTIIDPNIVKFVNDYRILKQGIKKGQAKRKAIPSKKVPIRKSKPEKVKKQNAAEALRQRALSKDSSKADQDAFLKSYARQSLSNI
jgi:FtsZ-binding cell division protein ZapB